MYGWWQAFVRVLDSTRWIWLHGPTNLAAARPIRPRSDRRSDLRAMATCHHLDTTAFGALRHSISNQRFLEYVNVILQGSRLRLCRPSCHQPSQRI